MMAPTFEKKFAGLKCNRTEKNTINTYVMVPKASDKCRVTPHAPRM